MDTGIPSDKFDAMSMFQYGAIKVNGIVALNGDDNLIPGSVINILGDDYIYEGLDLYRLMAIDRKATARMRKA